MARRGGRALRPTSAMRPRSIDHEGGLRLIAAQWSLGSAWRTMTSPHSGFGLQRAFDLGQRAFDLGLQQLLIGLGATHLGSAFITSLDRANAYLARALVSMIALSPLVLASPAVSQIGFGRPTVTISASPTNITSGKISTVTWSSTNAIACTASGGWSGPKPTSGTLAASPASTTTYTLTCIGRGG